MINDDKINYKSLIDKYPWIVQENQNCIVSPDCDGLLCGLLMSHYFNWKIVGFYDGKVMALKDKISVGDCVFLDMEIFRDFIKSVGQHLLCWDKKIDLHRAEWIKNFSNCISFNNIREFDGKNKFNRKYPFGTIHILLAIINNIKKINIKEDAICPLLYVDGTFKNMFNYPENCLDWLSFMHADDKDNPLHTIFFNNNYSTSSLMIALKEFFGKLRAISGGSRGGDKIVISKKDGSYVNFDKNKNELFDLSVGQQQIAVKFLQLLSQLTGWVFDNKKWNFNNFVVSVFSKGTITPNNRNFQQLMEQNPLSWAMTSGLVIEYTVEKNNFK